MWRDDERGQALQIGAVLLFGALVVALASYQAFVVPQQNERVEFSHSQTVQDQLQDLRNTLVSVSGASSTRSVSIRLGTRYPSRLVAVNPGVPTGSVRTRATGDREINVSVANAVADGETGDVWNGTERTYRTGWLWYRPNYNVYGGAPTTYYGSSVLFNEFPSGTVPLSAQALVDGDRVSLVALNGSVDATGTGAFSVDVRPVSASTRTVAVEGDGSENVTVRVPTRLSLSTWEDLLAGEFVDDGGHVLADKLRTEPLPGYPDARILVVELESGVTYDLQLAKAGVGSGVTDTGAAYTTGVSGNGSTVPEDGTTQLVVEVRDGYNNPISGVSVDAATNRTGSVAVVDDRTDDDGRVRLRYTAPGDVSSSTGALVNVSFAVDPATVTTFDATTGPNVTMELDVNDLDGSTTGGSGTPVYNVTWTNPSSQSGVTCPNGVDGVCTLDASQAASVDLTVATDPVAANANVDYALNDTGVADLDPWSGETDAAGENTTEFVPTDNGFVTVYAASGEDGDSLVVEVINLVSDLVYQNDATANDGPDSDSTAGGVEFSVVNQHGQSATVTSVKVNETGGNVAQLDDEATPNDEKRRTEIYVEADTNDGWVDENGGVSLPHEFDMDSDGFDNNGNPEVSSGGTMTVYLYEFENNGGSRQDMSGETITVTIFYELADGTQKSKKIDMTVS